MYQALYRKYRPKNFEEVYGQEFIVKTLKNAILNNKLSHAYIFCGPRGTGKTSIAKIISKTINCENLNGTLVCNECVNCTQSTTDIIEIDAASNNGVDEIRELKNKISLVPTYGKYKIYIIDEVHMLTISAFNALLKTLEEPPKHVIFILATTDPQKVPSTILSRCQRFDFKRIDSNSIFNRLKEIAKNENIDIDDSALYEIARISEGGLRDAINLLDQVFSFSTQKIELSDIHNLNGTVTQYQIEEFFDYYVDKNLNGILKKIDLYNSQGKNLVKLCQEFIYFLRNAILLKKAPKYLEYQNIDVAPYNKIQSKIDLEQLMAMIKDLNITSNEMKISQNPKLLFELFFIKNINIEENQLSMVSESTDIKFENKKIEKNQKKIYQNEKENIKNIRVNNTLARFSKKNLLKIKNEIEKIKVLLLESKYSQFVSLILDGSIKAASEQNIIFMYNIESDVKIFNDNIQIIEEIISKTLNCSYKVIAVNYKEWEIIKNEFNNKVKKYEYKEEPNIEKKENLNSIEKIFGDIIEYR